MTNATKPFTIQAGKQYITKDGQNTGPMIDTKDGSSRPFHAEMGGWYGVDGKSNISPSGIDIISEYVEQEPTAAPVTDEWGPWIGWNGGECPVDGDAVVQIVSSIGRGKPAKAGCYGWSDYIIAYRIKKEPEVRKFEGHLWKSLNEVYPHHCEDDRSRNFTITITNGKPSIRWADEGEVK